MDEVIRKAKICYQQSKKKGEVMGKKWTEKKSNNFVVGNKGNRGNISKGPPKGQINRNLHRNQSRFRPSHEPKPSEKSGKTEIEATTRPPVQCWGYGGPHYIKNFPNQKGTQHISQIHKAYTVGDIA